MSMIEEMIFYNNIRCISKFLIHDEDDTETQCLLAQIGRNERRRYIDRETIPVQVLEVLWNWGIELDAHPPICGMSRARFCESLWDIYQHNSDRLTREAALYLYVDTVQSGVIAKGSPRQPIFLKGPKGKEIPRFELKWMPGTIS